MPAIQKQPAGLLQLLGIYGEGRNPSDMHSTVQPVVDLGDLYAGADLVSQVQNLAGAQTVGDASTLEVPAGEAWYMLCLSGQLSTWSGVGDVSGLRLTVRPPRGTEGVPVINADTVFPTVAAVGDRFDRAFWFPTRWIALAGTQFSSVYQFTTVATCTMRTRALFHRLRA